MTAPGEEPRLSRPALLFLCTSFALVALDQGVLPPLLPIIARAWTDVSSSRAASLVACYAIGASLFPLLMGPLSDRVGRKVSLILGILLFAAGNTLFATAGSFAVALQGRALVGVGAGTVSFSVTALIGDSIGYHRRTRAMALAMAANHTALIAGVPLITFLQREDTPPGPFFLAFAALAGALALLGLARMPGHRAPRHLTPRLISTLREVFLRRNTAMGLLTSFLSAMAISTPVVFLSTWLISARGFTIREVGLVYLAGAAAPAFAAPLAGRLAAALGNRLLVSLTAIPLVLAICAFEPAARTTALLVPALFFVAVFMQTIRAASLQTLQTALVPENRRGTYLVIKNSIAQIGIAGGAYLGSRLFSEGGSFLPISLVALTAGLLSAVSVLLIHEDALETAGPPLPPGSTCHRTGGSAV